MSNPSTGGAPNNNTNNADAAGDVAAEFAAFQADQLRQIDELQGMFAVSFKLQVTRKVRVSSCWHLKSLSTGWKGRPPMPASFVLGRPGVSATIRARAT